MIVVDAVHAHAGDDKIPVWNCLFGYYSLCRVSLITEFSLACYQVYMDLDGFHGENFQSYMRMPAIVVDSFHVIRDEISRIEKIRAKQAEQRAAQQAGGKRGR